MPARHSLSVLRAIAGRRSFLPNSFAQCPAPSKSLVANQALVLQIKASDSSAECVGWFCWKRPPFGRDLLTLATVQEGLTESAAVPMDLLAFVSVRLDFAAA